MNQSTSPVLPAQSLAIEALLSRISALQSKPARTVQNAFVIEGLRSFIHACDAAFFLEAIFYAPILLKGDLADMLARRRHAAGVPRVRLSPEQFRAVSVAARASGIGAIARQRWVPLEHANVRRGIGFVVVEYIRSAGNLGTIMRTAEAAGASGVIFLSPPHEVASAVVPALPAADPFHPAAVRASMGGLFHVPLIRATHAQLGRWARRHGVMLVGLSPDAPRLWTELPAASGQSAPVPLALVLGEERQGISARLRAMCDISVRLPMRGCADSINVAMAASVMLYELVRRANAAQRG